MKIPNNRHARFAQYCFDNDIVELESKPDSSEQGWWLFLVKNCVFREDHDYRIPGDQHWQLRLKWINSNKTLPIEFYGSDEWWETKKPEWCRSIQYRESAIKEEALMQESALNVQIGGSHYKDCKIQPIQYIEANNLAFLEGCIVKRATRHDKPTGKGRVDIEKAIHELQLILELRYPTDEVKT